MCLLHFNVIYNYRILRALDILSEPSYIFLFTLSEYDDRTVLHILNITSDVRSASGFLGKPSEPHSLHDSSYGDYDSTFRQKRVFLFFVLGPSFPGQLISLLIARTRSGRPSPEPGRVRRQLSNHGKRRSRKKRCVHRDHAVDPIRKIFVPQTGHTPCIAGFPFFIVTCFASFISRFDLHLTQYASTIFWFQVSIPRSIR